MPDRIPVRRIACPSCGAPVEFDGPSTRCDYCGSVLERPSTMAEQPDSPPVVWPTATVSVPTAAARRVGCVITAAVLLLGVLVSGAIVYLAVFQTTTIAGPAIGSDGVATAVFQTTTIAGPAIGSDGVATSAERLPYRIQASVAVLTAVGDGQAPDLLVNAYDPNQSASVLLWLEGNPPTLRWAGEPLDVNSSNPVAVGATAVYVAQKQTLIALRRSDGGRLWQATTTDDVSAALCTDCVQEVGDVVVVLSIDGMLQAFDRADGSLLWSQQLEAQPRQLVLLGERIAVLDQEEGSEPDLLFWSAATGELVSRLSPRCPNRPFPNSPQGPSVYAPLTRAPGGEALFLPAGFFEPGCLLRLNADGTEAWQTTFPVDFLRQRPQPLSADGELYLAREGTILAINSDDGALTEQIMEEADDYALTPLGRQGNVLLVQAERQRGTRRQALWAYDRQSGARLWQYTPQAELMIDGRSVSLFGSSSGRWTWRALPAGILMVQVQPDPDRLVLEVLRLQDGASSGQTTIPLDDDGAGSLSLDLLGWEGERSWWLVNGRLWIVNGLTATVEALWPPR